MVLSVLSLSGKTILKQWVASSYNSMLKAKKFQWQIFMMSKKKCIATQRLEHFCVMEMKCGVWGCFGADKGLLFAFLMRVFSLQQEQLLKANFCLIRIYFTQIVPKKSPSSIALSKSKLLLFKNMPILYQNKILNQKQERRTL